MSMICTSGAIRLITPWHVPTKSSVEPEVGEERDEPVLHERDATTSDGRDEPVEVVGLRLGDDRQPDRGGDRVVCGPIDTAGARPPIAAYARAAEPDASTTTSPSGGSGASSRVR